MKTNFKGQTSYDRDYIPLKPERAKKYMHPDNLKNNKYFQGKTEYKRKFTRKQVPKDKEDLDRKWKEVIVENNIQSHIRGMLNDTDPYGPKGKGPKEYPKSSDPNNDDAYGQPGRPNPKSHYPKHDETYYQP